MSNQQHIEGGFLVLGATGGIGSFVCRRLVDGGHNVLLAAPKSDRLNTLASELKMPARVVDATSIDDVDHAFGATRESFGNLSGVVNCVGSVLLKPAHLTSESEWQETIALNLTSAFATVRSAGKTMKRSGGSVVLVSSAAARLGLANHEAIAAAKAGVIGLAKSAAASYASYGIRINAVAPGLVKTKMTEKIWQNERAAATSEAMHPLGRLGEPDEVASLIVWLLGQDSTWVTGEVFSIDGGLSTVKLNSKPASAGRGA